MSEDKNMTKRNPFTVPQDYFEKLHDRITQNLPTVTPVSTQSKQGVLYSIKNWSYAAAITTIFMIGGAAFYENNAGRTTDIISAEEYSNDYFDNLLENCPIDDYVIYSYLSSTDTGF